MKKFLILIILLCSSCRTIPVPADFHYREIPTRTFTLASWQKITSPTAPIKFYIEGDGYAFNFHGRPTKDPTPRGTTVRDMAFNDPSPNVVYLARPCQYILKKNPICSQRHWSTARFAPEVIDAEAHAIRSIAGNNEVILIGYSGGAQVAGLIAVNKPEIKIKKLISVAGNLDVLTWTTFFDLTPLSESLDLLDYRNEYLKFNQHHYVGDSDKVIPAWLVKNFLGGDENVTEVKGASHSSGWQPIYPLIWQEN